MTEKRYEEIDDNGATFIQDNKTGRFPINCLKELNALNDENEQLKQVIKIIEDMISVEKSNIFRCEYEEDKYEPEIRIDILEKLKKELSE